MSSHPPPHLHPPHFLQVENGWKHRTAEYVREPGIPKGWYQDGRQLRNVKTAKAFIWPKDGKDGSKWGRMKDILTNKGPDIYVAFGAKKGDCVSNRPTRAQWSRHTNLDEFGMRFPFSSKKFAPWTAKGVLGGRAPRQAYDFRTRKYGVPHPYMWSDAIWQPEPYKSRKWNAYPEAIRLMDGTWYQDPQHLSQWMGGPVDNEFGRGVPGIHVPDGHSIW